MRATKKVIVFLIYFQFPDKTFIDFSISGYFTGFIYACQDPHAEVQVAEILFSKLVKTLIWIIYI